MVTISEKIWFSFSIKLEYCGGLLESSGVEAFCPLDSNKMSEAPLEMGINGRLLHRVASNGQNSLVDIGHSFCILLGTNTASLP